MVFFYKQKTAYEMRMSDWSSDVCSSDLLDVTTADGHRFQLRRHGVGAHGLFFVPALGVPARKYDPLAEALAAAGVPRSEERRVGKECVRTCRARRSPDH